MKNKIFIAGLLLSGIALQAQSYGITFRTDKEIAEEVMTHYKHQF